MCDYSLMNLPNRLAVEGEELLVHRFPSGSLGLASPADLNSDRRDASGEHRSFWASLKYFFTAPDNCTIPAVCVPPGTRLRLQSIAERMRRQYGLEAQEEVTFDQLTAAPNAYRDAIVFQSGTKLRLQKLPEGQLVTVLALTSLTHDEETMASPIPVRSAC